MSFHDHFSDKAALYATARPRYPDALIAYIASLAPQRESVWDCGTGNGQAAVFLAKYFRQVAATDPSAEQVSRAETCPSVTYSVQAAETTNFPDHAFDAVCVAQALHWFDHEKFFAECQRVMKPGAVFAAWGYSDTKVTPEFDEAFKRLVLPGIAGDWPAQNSILWRNYQDVKHPFRTLKAPAFEIRVAWNFDQFMAYVHTWSALRRHINREGKQAIDEAGRQLAAAWGSVTQTREIVMPLAVIVGINEP